MRTCSLIMSSKDGAQEGGERDPLAELPALIGSESDSDDSDAEDPLVFIDPTDPSLGMTGSRAVRRGTREKRAPVPFHDEEHPPGRQSKVRKPRGRGRGRPGRTIVDHSGDGHVDLPPTELIQEIPQLIVDLNNDKMATKKDVDKFLGVVQRSLGWENEWEHNVGGVTLGSGEGPSNSAAPEYRYVSIGMPILSTSKHC